MKNKNKKLKVLDLFAGVGGLSYGFELAGFEISGAIEFDQVIAESMKKNHKNTKIFTGDIRNIKPNYVKKEMNIYNIIDTNKELLRTKEESLINTYYDNINEITNDFKVNCSRF